MNTLINIIWLILIVLGVITTAYKGNIESITLITVEASTNAVTIAFQLIGLVAFWSGMARIAEEAGLTTALAKLMGPVIRWLFPSIPKDHPALAAIAMSMSANLLGLGNACTPLGIKAMSELHTLNPDPEQATAAMCTFVAITASSLTILPTTIISLRAAMGSMKPGAIIGPTMIATSTSTLVAIVADRLMGRYLR
jgi:spore maturation protein A